MRHVAILTAIFLLTSGAAGASLDESPVPVFTVRAETPPLLDGVLDDAIWERAETHSNFQTVQPAYGAQVSERTVARVAYDRDYLYVAIEAFDSQPELIRANVSKWDDLFNDDFVGVIIDGLNDGQSAYAFTVNAVGSQADIIINSSGDGDASPDFIWDAAGTLHDRGYTVEMRIPFQSLRFQAGDQVAMGMQFGRQIVRKSEIAFFPPVIPERGSQLSQMGQAHFRDLAYHRTYELLPALTQTESQSLPAGGQPLRDNAISGTNVGLTAKVGLTSTLTLDLTLNPDFSQVESDAGQIDANTRSPLFFPEKRPFFLEGAENFSLAGTGKYGNIQTALHTRTISNPQLGMKVTGKLGSSNAVAALVAVDDVPADEDTPGGRATVGVARYKRLLGSESYLGGMAMVRESATGSHQMAAVDGVWRLTGTTRLESHAMITATRTSPGGAPALAHDLQATLLYRTQASMLNAWLSGTSPNFKLETGFVPRDGINSVGLLARRTFYFNNPIVHSFIINYFGYVQRDLYAALTEQRHSPIMGFNLARSSWIFAGGPRASEVYEGVLYDINGTWVSIGSQLHKTINVQLNMRWDGSPNFDEDDPFQGDRAITSGEFSFQPTDKLTLNLSISREVFDRRSTGEQVFDIRITRGKLTYQLNKYLFLRGIGEFNSDEGTLTTDLLASFTYFPGSVVYLGFGALYEDPVADGYEPSNGGRFALKQRGLFFKASYNWRI